MRSFSVSILICLLSFYDEIRIRDKHIDNVCTCEDSKKETP